jgi:protein-glutamine gamma-glutamyltransferase
LSASAGDTKAFARAVCDWLASRHGYSLQMTLAPGEGDPLVRWMDSNTAGHCELFAGAFTLLARSAGYPARMVTGFRGGSWNEGGNHLSVRNSDAHAWCEIYDATTRRWVRVDPTPGATLPGQALANETSEAVLARIQDRSWNARLDAVRMFWYRRIVDFDQSSQAELVKEAKSAIQSYGNELKKLLNARLAAIREWLSRPWDFARLAAWIFVVASAFSVVLGWRYYGRGLWLHWRSGMTRKGVDPVRREAGRWLRKLDAGSGGDLVVRAELERLRYGPRQSWPNPQGAFRRAKRACAGRRAE